MHLGVNESFRNSQNMLHQNLSRSSGSCVIDSNNIFTMIGHKGVGIIHIIGHFQQEILDDPSPNKIINTEPKKENVSCMLGEILSSFEETFLRRTVLIILWHFWLANWVSLFASSLIGRIPCIHKDVFKNPFL